MRGSVLGMCRRKGGSYNKFLFAERFWFKARFGAAGILCVFQGVTNEFLAEKIRQNPQTHLRGVALILQLYYTIGMQADKTFLKVK